MQLYYPTSTDVEEEASSVAIRCSEDKIEPNTSQTGMEPIIPGNNAICEEERSFALHFFLYMYWREVPVSCFFFFFLSHYSQKHTYLIPLSTASTTFSVAPFSQLVFFSLKQYGTCRLYCNVNEKS